MVLKGIEIGYIASEKDRIIDYLADKDYDLKLLSVHHNGQFDYLDDEVKDMDPAIVIPQYFAQRFRSTSCYRSRCLCSF